MKKSHGHDSLTEEYAGDVDNMEGSIINLVLGNRCFRIAATISASFSWMHGNIKPVYFYPTALCLQNQTC